MNLKSIGFIGGGRITRIFLQAFRNKNIELDSIVVYDNNPDVWKALLKQFPQIQNSDSPGAAAKQEIIFMALHPPVIMETLDTIRGQVPSESMVVSLAPKITMEKFASKLSTSKIVRLIPNATSFINEGYNPVCFSRNVSEEEKTNVLEMLNVLGYTFEVPENKLEGYAIISAMLPTYFWFQWKEIMEIGNKTGLTEPESREAVYQTLIAALNLMYKSGLTYEKVTDLIPVKPIMEHEEEIKKYFQGKLLSLFEKIKP